MTGFDPWSLEPPTVPIASVPRHAAVGPLPWVPPILLVAVGLAVAMAMFGWGMYLGRDSWNAAPRVTPPAVSAPSGSPSPP